MPKFSVIISTYNRAKYLSGAIDSVLKQTYQDIEIIVIDDGSCDDTKSIMDNYIKTYPGKIKYFYQDNKGQSAAINRGIKEAIGEFVAFLDSDDIWLPEKLKVYLEYFQLNPQVSLIGGRMFVIDKNGNQAGNRLKPQSQPGNDFKTLVEKGGVSTSSIVVKRSFLNDIFFDETLPKHNDLDFCLKVANRSKILNIENGLTLYREHSNNSCANKINLYGSQIIFWKKVILEYGNKINKKICYRKIAKNSYLLSKEYFIAKDFRNSVHRIINGIKYDFLLGKNFWTTSDSLINKLIKILKPCGLMLVGMFISIFYSRNADYIKNILFYESSSGFAGSANALANNINNLNRKKFSPIIAIKNYGSKLHKINDTEIIKLKYFPEPKQISSFNFLIFILKNYTPEILKLYFIIKRKRISLVHINTNMMLGTPIIAAKIAGIPCVCHLRETRKLIKREKILSKWVDKFIVLNKDAYENYGQEIPKSKLSIIYDGIDLDEFGNIREETFRNEFNLNNHPLIGLVGRIVEGKGHREFVLAAKNVLKHNPKVKFIIVGDAKGGEDIYCREIKNLVIDECLNENILFTGWRNDIKNIISALDILVLPSTTFPEGLPNVIIEAMAAKKPVIATDIPGPSDIVIDGETGFLVSPGDIKAMSEKMIYLLDNREIAERMGEEGRKRAEELFDIKNRVRDIEKLYEDILTKNDKKNNLHN